MVLHWVEGVCHGMALECVANTENWKLKKIVLIKCKPSRFALAFPQTYYNIGLYIKESEKI